MPDIATDLKDGVLQVTLCRPERKNAVTLEMWEALARAFEKANEDAEVRVVVVRGAGGNFCSGADLGGSSDRNADDRTADAGGDAYARSLAMLRRSVAPAAVALHRLSKPSIALVEGVAAGAGCNIALGCDLAYATEDARFSQIFVRRALSLDFGGAWILPRLVGLQRAKELAYFGDFVSARDALAMGLIAGVESADEIEERVGVRARRLADQSPLALAAIKRSLEDSLALSFEEAVDREFVLQASCTISDDFAEGVRAFMEKRPPRYSGR